MHHHIQYIIRECHAQGAIEVLYVPTRVQLALRADILMKALPPGTVQKLRHALNVCKKVPLQVGDRSMIEDGLISTF